MWEFIAELNLVMTKLALMRQLSYDQVHDQVVVSNLNW